MSATYRIVLMFITCMHDLHTHEHYPYIAHMKPRVLHKDRLILSHACTHAHTHTYIYTHEAHECYIRIGSFYHMHVITCSTHTHIYSTHEASECYIRIGSFYHMHADMHTHTHIYTHMKPRVLHKDRLILSHACDNMQHTHTYI